jgi:uncharacterized membrane protein
MPASWGDVVSLIVISTLFFGAVAGFIYVTEAAKKATACAQPMYSDQPDCISDTASSFAFIFSPFSP